MAEFTIYVVEGPGFRYPGQEDDPWPCGLESEPWCGAKEPRNVYRCTRTLGHDGWHGGVKSDWPQDATDESWPPR